jgi:hypothetical protein
VAVFFGVPLVTLSFFFSQFWPVPVVVAVWLLAWSLIAPQEKGLMLVVETDHGGQKMDLPVTWNEKEIQLGFMQHQTGVPDLLHRRDC